MSNTKKQHTPTQPSILFGKENYLWMAIGVVVIALGFLLMSGGKNPDPNVFDTKLVYSFTRITLAPFVIVIGLLIEIYAICKKPAQQKAQ